MSTKSAVFATVPPQRQSPVTITTPDTNQKETDSPPQTAVVEAGSVGTQSVVAVLLMVVGIGWNAGLEARPFQPATTGIAALAMHIAPLIALILLLVPVLRSGPSNPHQGRRVSVAAVLALLFGTFSMLFSVTHPHAVAGIHNVNDILPIAILDAGALLWLMSSRWLIRRPAR